MTYSFEHSTLIAAPPEVVFDLQLDMDLHAESLRGTGERATTSTGRPTLTLGDEVTFEAWHLGVRWRMRSRVVEYERPRRFVDEQVRGPFARLRHEHVFEPYGSGTRMVDRVVLTAPFGPLGAVVEHAGLGRYMSRLIRRRGTYVKQVAERLWRSP